MNRGPILLPAFPVQEPPRTLREGLHESSQAKARPHVHTGSAHRVPACTARHAACLLLRSMWCAFQLSQTQAHCALNLATERRPPLRFEPPVATERRPPNFGGAGKWLVRPQDVLDGRRRAADVSIDDSALTICTESADVLEAESHAFESAGGWRTCTTICTTSYAPPCAP